MIGKKKKYKLGDFNYNLSKKFISQYPEKKRDHSKLMVVHKESGEIEHKNSYTLHQNSYCRNNPFSKQLLVHCSGSGSQGWRMYGLISIFVLVLESFFELGM